MSATEDLAKLLSKTSPAGVKARAVVIERARHCRFKLKGVHRRMINELATVSSLDLTLGGDTAPEWALFYHIELKSAIGAMVKALDFQQVFTYTLALYLPVPTPSSICHLLHTPPLAEGSES
jgi:hypothetical protein